MNHRKSLVLMAVLGLASTALAGEVKHRSLSIAVVDDETRAEARVELDEESLGFELEDMQVGENRAVIDNNGQNVLITREDDGYRFDVGGKTIRAPLYHSTADDEFDIVVNGAPHAAHAPPPPPLPPIAPGRTGTTIISAEPIDDDTQRAIEDLLKAAGHDPDVRFVSRADAGGIEHEVRIVRKQVSRND